MSEINKRALYEISEIEIDGVEREAEEAVKQMIRDGSLKPGDTIRVSTGAEDSKRLVKHETYYGYGKPIDIYWHSEGVGNEPQD